MTVLSKQFKNSLKILLNGNKTLALEIKQFLDSIPEELFRHVNPQLVEEQIYQLEDEQNYYSVEYRQATNSNPACFIASKTLKRNTNIEKYLVLNEFNEEVYKKFNKTNTFILGNFVEDYKDKPVLSDNIITFTLSNKNKLKPIQLGYKPFINNLNTNASIWNKLHQEKLACLNYETPFSLEEDLIR